MSDRIWIRPTVSNGGQPEFRCSIHDQVMWEDKKLLMFSCSSDGCHQKIEFNKIREIAQWLRGYA